MICRVLVAVATGGSRPARFDFGLLLLSRLELVLFLRMILIPDFCFSCFLADVLLIIVLYGKSI